MVVAAAALAPMSDVGFHSTSTDGGWTFVHA
jgi:hypothetical protein